MQRILVSAVVAVLIHGGIVFFNPFWKTAPKQVPENDRAISISISHVSVQKKLPAPPPPKPPEQKKEVPVPPPKAPVKKEVPKKEPVKKKSVPVRKAVMPEQKKESPIIPEEPETVSKKNNETKVAEPAGEPELPASEPAEVPAAEEKISPDLPIDVKPVPVKKDAIPVYKQNPLPRYPRNAKRLGHSGTVQLMVLVDKKGTVKNIWIFESSGYTSLDQEAVRTVMEWLFEPGEINGDPEEMWVKIPVTFKINKASQP